MTGQKLVWWHPSWRVSLAIAGSAVIAVAAALAAARGQPAITAIFAVLLVASVVAQTRPWFYAYVPRAPLVFRLISIVVFLVPAVTISSSRVTVPKPLLGLAVGVLGGAGLLVAFHARDSILLLNPAIVAVQPRMSIGGAIGRFGYVVLVVPLEEIFYRRLIIDNLTPHVGAVLAILVSVLAFVYGDWSGSWGPASRQKRLWSEVVLATVLALLYLWTGSLAGVIVAHYIYNLPQLLLPPINLAVHARTKTPSTQES